MKLRIFQKGFNYSQDGPGNRLVFHLQGCNMKCPWCANPEGMSVKGSIMIDKAYIMDSMCPHGAIKDKNCDFEKCSKCGLRECIAENNRNKGIFLSCEELETDEVLALIKKCSSLFYDGGGITFTGGEATVQADALLEVLKGAKEMGINTALETNAGSPRMGEIIPYIDHLMTDYKLPFADKHESILGIPQRIVQDNIRNASNKMFAAIRIPLIHNINDSEEALKEFIRFFKTCNIPNISIELLAYHEYGKNKWEQIGKPYQMPDDSHVTKDTIRHFQEEFKKEGFSVVHS